MNNAPHSGAAPALSHRKVTEKSARKVLVFVAPCWLTICGVGLGTTNAGTFALAALAFEAAKMTPT